MNTNIHGWINESLYAWTSKKIKDIKKWKEKSDEPVNELEMEKKFH